MKVLIVDRADRILSEEQLKDGDFALFGNGAINVTITMPGIPDRLLLLENWGRVIAEGRFFKDIALNKHDHFPGDRILVQLSVA